MSYGTLIRNGVALAHRLLVAGGVEVAVVHRAASTPDVRGNVVLGDPVNRTALWRKRVRAFRQSDGTIVNTRGVLTFLGSVEIGMSDQLVVQGVGSGPVLEVDGLADAEQGGRFVTKVWLGDESIG